MQHTTNLKGLKMNNINIVGLEVANFKKLIHKEKNIFKIKSIYSNYYNRFIRLGLGVAIDKNEDKNMNIIYQAQTKITDLAINAIYKLQNKYIDKCDKIVRSINDNFYWR